MLEVSSPFTSIIMTSLYKKSIHPPEKVKINKEESWWLWSNLNTKNTRAKPPKPSRELVSVHIELIPSSKPDVEVMKGQQEKAYKFPLRQGDLDGHSWHQVEIVANGNSTRDKCPNRCYFCNRGKGFLDSVLYSWLYPLKKAKLYTVQKTHRLSLAIEA